jgi:hypothetical protein
MQTSFTPPIHDAGVILKPTQSEIAAVAYHLYLEQGSRNGHDLDDWLRAEQVLIQQLNEAPAPKHIPFKELAEDIGVRALDRREYPLAQEERRGTDRKDVRRNTSSYRPASRQPRSGRQISKESARNGVEPFVARS